MSHLVLGLDLGTSAVKCVLCQDGKILGSGSAALEVSSPRPGWSEQTPTDWITAAKTAMAKAATAAGRSLSHVSGIALSGQMHGAVVLDDANTPIRPAILWNDNRAVQECSTLSNAVSGIGHIAGVPPLPGFTAPKVMWMRHHEPALYERISHIILPKDFISLWLTGEIATDLSDAAGTVWLDQKNRTWSPDIIAASGVNPDWLPSLHHGFDQIGAVRSEVAHDTGLSTGTPVFAGGGDAATGALSIGAASAGACFMSLGTSGQLLVVDASYRPNPAQFVHAYCHTLPDLWYRMAAMLNGARPLAWFAGILGCDVAQLLSEAARADPDRVPTFLPYLTGERSPHGDPDVRAGFYGLEDATRRPDMCRAVVEAIAFSMRDALDSFGNDVIVPNAIPVIGGGSQSDLVLQTLASALEIPVARSSAGSGGAAYGAALLAKIGLGRARDTVSVAPKLEDVFDPDPTPALMDRLGTYRDLYQSVKS